MVLLYAAKYKDVHTVVNISGRFFLERGIEMRLGKDYLKRIKENGFIDVSNRKVNLLVRTWLAYLRQHLSFFSLQESLNIELLKRV